MGYIIFTNGTKKFSCWVERFKNIVVLHFKDDIPSKSTMRGFTWHYSDISEPCDYTEFNTVYRWHDGIYQLSNDGSVFVPTVKFTSNGGALTGDLEQRVSSYSDLVAPTPIDDENWEFKNWNPSIPTSGVIHENETYQAVFEFIGTPPVPEPTTEERIEDVEVAICDLSEELSTSISDLETALCDLSTEEV